MKIQISQEISRETFCWGFFMPCHHAAKGEGFKVAVKTSEIEGIDYFIKNEIPKIPNMYKHLSINTRKICYKQTKKIQ
jgi:DNA-binding Lrp family transcriptional regulator